MDLIVTTEATSAKAAQAATTRIPIIFTSASDPVGLGLGLVQSFARPGGNVTGIADLDVQLAPKRMELFHELIPTLRRDRPALRRDGPVRRGPARAGRTASPRSAGASCSSRNRCEAKTRQLLRADHAIE